MTEHLVSVITPLYNAQQFISQTIRTVQAQTYTNWEMVIVDDCSTDRSPAIVQEFAAGDPRIKYYKNECNLGAADTRNRAIELAEGRYIAFLDSDDLWHPDKLERQLALMQERGSAFCFGGCNVIDENGQDIHKTRIVPASVSYEDLLGGNVIPCLTVLIDRVEIPEIKLPHIPHEDYAAWLTILKNYGKPAVAISEAVGDYRQREASLSGNKIQAMQWTWDIYRKYLKLPLGKSIACFIKYAKAAMGKHM